MTMNPVSAPAPQDPDGAQAILQTEANYVPNIDDFYAPSPPKIYSPLSRFPGPGTVKPALIAFIFFFVISVRNWTSPTDAGLWVSRDSIFVNQEYWRLFTALFSHADLGHLLSNAPLFLLFGWFLRAFFGFWVFPVATFLIGAASNLATIYFYNPGTQLVGASGMLYGMVALWLVLYVRFETKYTVSMRLFRAVAVSLIMLFPTSFHETTSYLAHFMGFIIGMGAGYAMAPFLKVIVPNEPEQPQQPQNPAGPGPRQEFDEGGVRSLLTGSIPPNTTLH